MRISRPNLNRINLEMGEILHKTFLENWTETDTHTHTDPRTTRNPVSQHYRVGLEKTSSYANNA